MTPLRVNKQPAPKDLNFGTVRIESNYHSLISHKWLYDSC